MAKVDEDKIWLGGALFVVIDLICENLLWSCNTTNYLLKHTDQYLHLSHPYIFFVLVFEGSASFLWDYLGSKEFLVIVTMTVWKVSFWNNRKWCLRFASLWFIFIQIFQSDYLFHLWEILLLRYSWRWLWSPSLWFLFVQLDLKEMAPSQPSF